MKASGYASSANHDVESWLISPLLEIPTLSTGETIKLKFSVREATDKELAEGLHGELAHHCSGNCSDCNSNCGK